MKLIELLSIGKNRAKRMNKSLLIIVLCLLFSPTLAARSIITISQAEFAKEWAFTKGEVQLQCTREGALFVINESTLVQYPLEASAIDLVARNKVRAQPLAKILRDDPKRPGQKMSVEPFIARARLLCQ